MGTLTANEANGIDAIVRGIAQRIILPAFGAAPPQAAQQKSGADDLVTETDQAAERALITELQTLLPTANIFGEETFAEDPARLDSLKDPGLHVVIDPIDGTWNFANGIAVFGTMIAVIEAGETQFGLIHDPISGESIVAHRGGGAFTVDASGGRTPIHVAPDIPGGAEFGLFGSTWLHRPQMAALSAPYARATSLGASAHDYRMLCKGHYHTGLNYQLNVWDHAAGQLIHTEAGGASSLADGQAYSPLLREGILMLAHTEPRLAALRAAFAETNGN